MASLFLRLSGLSVVEHVLFVSLHALVVFLGAYDELIPSAHAGTSQDEVTADHVLLHTLEVIDLTADSSLTEHLRGLLEGGGTHEALRTQGGTGDTLQDLSRGCGHSVTHLDGLEVTALEA